ncbi:hypothetical protein J4573_38655 [Actinomadura barringtoniae]|uniref:Uncharacterized protein n=1 Tax=Actinomadura barringtoniae TaxID=1427535 RepID=A0A939TB12_9ACTN|nr:hypothetical protein [Actinomadura barringtoniae]MBO2453067.1 hypothetical protein [Actinomadura barringtoniae]
MKWPAYSIGAMAIAYGAYGIASQADKTHPFSYLLWLAGSVALHDALIAPVVLLAGALTGLLKESFRTPLRTALALAAVTTLVTLPTLLAFGRRKDNPSILPLDYPRGLLIVLAVIAATTLIVSVLSRRRARSG